jgi:hypothetical protein
MQREVTDELEELLWMLAYERSELEDAADCAEPAALAPRAASKASGSPSAVRPVRAHVTPAPRSEGLG